MIILRHLSENERGKAGASVLLSAVPKPCRAATMLTYLLLLRPAINRT